MPDKFIFADEAGCFAFNRTERASRYFILCTVTMSDCSLSNELLKLRRHMAFHHNATRRFFHCVADPWPAREEVFRLLSQHEFRVDATILEKCKARPDIRESEVRFFHYAWFYHFKYIAKRVRNENENLLITAASINQNDQKAAFKQAIHDTAQQCMPHESWQVAFLNSAEDPCLWVADYCAWAIQRKWERGEERAFDFIRDKVSSQFDLFRTGRTEYY